jgi:Zn-dependent protease with chaperone function
MRAGVGERATLDFFAAQARARRRTAVLALSFALAVAVVVAVVYVALLVTVGTSNTAALLEPALGMSSPSWFRPEVLLAATGIVGAVTGLGTAYHALRLSSGGGDAVAQMLGGSPVDRATQDPALRRLVNVTEEMAVASGLPVPRLYVLEREAGINAFAAGYTPGHGIVAVTRGALDKLDRDELQGVVAHELSHLLNGDTRIDLRLMAAVGGLTVLSLLGRVILRATPSSRSRRERATGALPLWGSRSWWPAPSAAFCGGSSLRRGAPGGWRTHRRWFTRNPGGLAGALGRSPPGSLLANRTRPAAHLFFASAGRVPRGLFRPTHRRAHPPPRAAGRGVALPAGALAAASGRRLQRHRHRGSSRAPDPTST